MSDLNPAALMGGRSKDSPPRDQDDFYPTPPDVTHALMSRIVLSGSVYEPCCGDGAMAEVLAQYVPVVHASDLRDRGYGKTGVDALELTSLPSPNVVTNPPFKLAEPLIKHLLGMRPAFMAMLLKTNYWQTKRRLELFHETKLSWVLPLTWRPDFTNRGSPVMECAWFVWERDYTGPTRYQPLARPKVA